MYFAVKQDQKKHLLAAHRIIFATTEPIVDEMDKEQLSSKERQEDEKSQGPSRPGSSPSSDAGVLSPGGATPSKRHTLPTPPTQAKDEPPVLQKTETETPVRRESDASKPRGFEAVDAAPQTVELPPPVVPSEESSDERSAKPDEITEATGLAPTNIQDSAIESVSDPDQAEVRVTEESFQVDQSVILDTKMQDPKDLISDAAVSQIADSKEQKHTSQSLKEEEKSAVQTSEPDIPAQDSKAGETASPAQSPPHDLPEASAAVQENTLGIQRRTLPALPTDQSASSPEFSTSMPEASFEDDKPEPTPKQAPLDDGKPEPPPQLDSKPTPQLDSEPAPQLDSKPTPQLDSERTPQLDSEPTPQWDSEPTPQLDSERTPQLDSERTPQLDSEPAPQADVETGNPSQPEADETPTQDPIPE